MDVLNLTCPFDHFKEEVEETLLKLSLHVNHFPETNTETDGLTNTSAHHGDCNRTAQIGAAADSG